MADNDTLILVDEKDREVGFESKERCHDPNPIRHRAFTVMLFDKGRLLLTRRSHSKRLWPRLWDGSISSHPRKGERIDSAVKRRVKEELGVNCTELRFLFKFEYKVSYKNKGAEHEINYIFAAPCSEGRLRPDSSEISEVRFIPVKDLEKQVENPEFAPWLQIALKEMQKRKLESIKF